MSYMSSYSTGCEPLTCIIHLSLGTRNSFLLSLYPINKTSEMSCELIPQEHSFLSFTGHFTAIAGNALTPPSLLSDCNFTFFIKPLQCCLTLDLTTNCHISKVWVQDVTPWEHAAVTNMISNWCLPIQSGSSNSRHFMGKAGLRKT